MKLYLDIAPSHPYMITREALEIMGCPRLITMSFDYENNRILIMPLKYRPRDMGYITICEAAYRNHGGFGVCCYSDVVKEMRSMARIPDDNKQIYEVDADVMMFDEIALNNDHGGKRNVKAIAPCVLMYMDSAKPVERIEEPVYVAGGDRIITRAT